MSKFDLVKLMWYHNKVRWKVRRLSGAPPLSFKGRGKNLKNYRIYGNTVNGESVGDRTDNLFDYKTHSGTISGYYLDNAGNEVNVAGWNITDYIPCDGLVFTITPIGGNRPSICFYDQNKNFIYGQAYNTIDANNKITISISLNTPAYYIRFSYITMSAARDDLTTIMLNSGSEPLPYEPYGYRVPVTVTNGTDTETTNLYLPEQIKMVGDETEYIDFGKQKQYFADGTSTDVLLPALPTISGTNTLLVGTEVQPSEVYVEGKIRFIHEGSGENEGE